MNVITKKIKDIVPYENNPRFNKGAVDQVAKSIKEYGFKVPIVIDKEGVIVAGHTRYESAKKLKMKEIPCIIADDLDEKQIRAFRIADNKVSEFAGWDFEKLDQEFELLGGKDEMFTGFTDADFEDAVDFVDIDDLKNNESGHLRGGRGTVVFNFHSFRITVGQENDQDIVCDDYIDLAKELMDGGELEEQATGIFIEKMKELYEEFKKMTVNK